MNTPDVRELEPLLRRVLAEQVLAEPDGPALNELLARLRGYIHARIRQQLRAGADGVIDRSALVQSVCRRVWVHFPELEGPDVPRLLGWIGTVTRNRVNQELRQIARRPLGLLGSDAVNLTDPAPTAESQARADRAAALAAALAKLPDRERRVVEAKWFDRQSDEFTARELGIAVNNVRQIRFRALEALRGLLAGAVEDRP